MENKILIQEVKVGQRFYMLNKFDLPKYNGNMTFEMTRNTGNGIVEFTRLEKVKYYNEGTRYNQFVVLINN